MNIHPVFPSILSTNFFNLQEKLTRMVHRIVNKLLHEPTVRLKASAAEGNGVEYAQAIRDLFALNITGTVESSPAGERDGNGVSTPHKNGQGAS